MAAKAPVSLIRTDRMVWIPGGTFTMGSDHYYPEEAPARKVTVSAFWIDPKPVTNAEFARFVRATDYITVAERPSDPGSVVFVKPPATMVLRNAYWWRYIPGANWRHPFGPDSSIKGLEEHPVVHVAYADVERYCSWSGKTLPTEAEWEFAARGGLQGADYAWGDEFEPDGQIMANTWQGEFPFQNLATDGFEWTSPVGSFPPNRYGLYDMIGNVWEWTSDWYQEHRTLARYSCATINPKGGDREQSVDARIRGARIPRKVMKGGSYLCAPNYCQRYRPAARMAQPVDTSTCHLGFRCIRRAGVQPQMPRTSDG